uniref:Uncharacterized protein n=1 Tax=Seriola lalandi dorsalis TaxID=1841481 RepID=A0A3B4Y476_SERLL
MTTKHRLITDSFKVVKKAKRAETETVREEELQKLRQFDLDWRFGPCTGNTHTHTKICTDIKKQKGLETPAKINKRQVNAGPTTQWAVAPSAKLPKPNLT